MEASVKYEGTVLCCGMRVAVDTTEVQSVMISHGLPPSEQAREWLRLARLYPDPVWMELCRVKAQAMVEWVRSERELLGELNEGDHYASTPEGRLCPLSPHAERHFEWLGDRHGVLVEVVRGGIAKLAGQGYISLAMEQQEALRRGLGLMVSDAECRSAAPWVRWMGEGGALNYLVNELWELGLITCTGGRSRKWQTLRGVFLRADGTCFGPSIKSNECRNEEKRRDMENCLLKSLRLVVSRKQ